MSQPFYVKCRPQKCDIESLVLKHRRVFIGYPPWRTGGEWDRNHVSRSCFDLSAPEGEWSNSDLAKRRSYKRSVTMNRNLARKVTPGTWVVVPRPGKGICHVGQIKSTFELVESPKWAEEYLKLRRQKGLETEPEQNHVGDVIQGWEVREFRTVPFPLVPRWITYRLLSRDSIGKIPDRPDGKRAATTALKSLFDGDGRERMAPTQSSDEIAGRMLDWLSPAAFEHLVSDLMQCEHPNEYWWQVGGSGDGGVDVLGSNNAGQIVGAVQCKWKLSRDPWQIGKAAAANLSAKQSWNADAHVYVAALYQSKWKPGTKGSITFLDAVAIAEKLITHANSCAMARTLRVV